MIKLLKYNYHIMMHYLLTYYEQSWGKMFPKEIRGLEDPESFKKDNDEKSEKKHTALTTRFLKALTDPYYFSDKEQTDFLSFISY
tara:strand:+ start:341 stop:595 length:255 start_codon:yes stop_codon:yes gene_type:complete